MALPERITSDRPARGRGAARRVVTRDRSDAAPVARTRSHGEGRSAARAAGPRPMVRATAGIQASPSPRPTLTVVPRRRRAARFVAAMCVVVGVAMLAAAAFQTQLARRQLEMDRLDQGIAAAREQYEVLRQRRAELRSPERLAGVASAAGMVPTKQSTFVSLSPDLIATVQESVGPLSASAVDESSDELDQFRLVKSLTTRADP